MQAAASHSQRVVEEEQLGVRCISADLDLAELYRLKLEIDGYAVHCANPQNLDRPLKQAADIVFLDIGEAGPDGQALLARVRSDQALRRLPLILLSSRSQSQLRDLGYRFAPHEHAVSINNPPVAVQPGLEWGHPPVAQGWQ
jgi:CheY-like chemotaxis protein